MPVNHTKPGASKFINFKPDTFAQQLTLLQSNLFAKIEPHELLYWLKGEREHRERMAPNLDAFIKFSNRLTLWVATEIVSAATPKECVAVLKKMVLVGQYCLKYKNYQALLEIIVGGLGHFAVLRLEAWNLMLPKYSEMRDKLAAIVSNTQNWKNYRPLIENETQPFLPYVGLFLADMTFIVDATKSHTEDGRINWKKMAKIASYCAKVVKIQTQRFTFAPNADILRFLTEEMVALDEKALVAKCNEAKRSRSNTIY